MADKWLHRAGLCVALLCAALFLAHGVEHGLADNDGCAVCCSLHGGAAHSPAFAYAAPARHPLPAPALPVTLIQSVPLLLSACPRAPPL